MADKAEAEDGAIVYESKVVVRATAGVPTEAPAPEPAMSGGSNGADPEADGIPVSDESEYAPAPGSVYLAASLPGYDAARAAMDSGEYWGVCVFYDALPDGLLTARWQTKIPEDGEKARWLLSAEELENLEGGAAWDEFYYGDRDAGQGLVIVIAGEEE